MGQKVNATGFRVGFVKGWNSSWYNPLNTKGYANLLIEDLKIQKYIKGSLNGSKRLVDLINIYRSKLGTYIYLGQCNKMLKASGHNRRVSLLLKNRIVKNKALKAFHLRKKSTRYINHLKKKFLIKIFLNRKIKLIKKKLINKLKYKNLSNISNKNLKIFLNNKRSFLLNTSKKKINKNLIKKILLNFYKNNKKTKNINKLFKKEIIKFLIKKTKKKEILTFNKKKKNYTHKFCCIEESKLCSN